MSEPLVLIQARSGGTRLPGKIGMMLGSNTMIDHVMDRVHATGLAWRLCLAEDWLHVAENDVLGRFRALLADLDPEGTRYDPILRVTADCPMLDSGLVRRALAIYCDRQVNTRRGSEYFRQNWQPVGTHPAWDGLDVEVFSRSLLDHVNHWATEPEDREHVTRFMRKHFQFQVVLLDGPALRFSVDDQAGLDFVRAVFAACEHCLAGQPHRMRESAAGLRPNWAIHDVYGLHPGGAPEPMACEAFDLLEERTGGPIYVSH